MKPTIILGWVAVYFTALMALAWWTGRKADDQSYFLGNRRSPWIIVALGLIGDSLSGVSYISVPGKVARDHFGYLQVVFGYVLGYLIIAFVLLPLYYRLGLTSIYAFLGQRFDPVAQKTGSAFFLVSRLLGSAARLFLAINVFQSFVFSDWGIPFWITSATVILLILAYTLRGGIKTLVWTDTFQTAFLVAGILTAILALTLALKQNAPLSTLVMTLLNGPETTVFNWDWRSPGYFWKQFFSGAAIAVVMTGLDQNNMQKALSCPSLADAQKNIALFTPIMVAVHIAILLLGALLFRCADSLGISLPDRSDDLFPTLALRHLGIFPAILFVLGLTAATFNSADSVLTTLTTSFCIDFLRFESRNDLSDRQRIQRRRHIHIAFAGILLLTILLFRAFANGTALIDLVLKLAGYTYGPLLGLFTLGLTTRIRAGGWPVPVVGLLAVAGSALLDFNSAAWFNGYRFGFELLLLNGFLMAIGMVLFAGRSAPSSS